MNKLTPPVNKNDHIQGPPDALITLVEYGDYECPSCGMAYPIIKEIQETFGKDLRFVFRNFPLSNAHPYALHAARAAEAAGKQNKLWEMHDILFERQDLFSPHAFLTFAQEIGLDIPAFKMALQDKSLEEKIESDFESGVRSGVNGTPSFFINGLKYNGSYEYDSLAGIIEEQIHAVS